MRVFSESSRSSTTTFLRPLGPGPEMDGSDAGPSTPASAPGDGASVHVPRAAGSTSGRTRTGMDGRPVNRASSGAWPDDAPTRIPSGRLEALRSTTAGLATGDASPDPSPDPEPQDAPSDGDNAPEHSVADATAPRPSRADQVRAQARAAKLQMRAQAETARRAQAHATGAAVRDLIE
ncbi:hypothetical protein [Salinibacter ruber]|uniref:hypothetical protein n=1 Tax=Salinibacter ruber TaxID=146919 RepID=UPI00216A6629|nr:hypothetical protein [Salinibacter ruber]MCS3645400.1 hypothetical protein [Salinibacter ruber]